MLLAGQIEGYRSPLDARLEAVRPGHVGDGRLEDVSRLVVLFAAEVAASNSLDACHEVDARRVRVPFGRPALLQHTRLRVPESDPVPEGRISGFEQQTVGGCGRPLYVLDELPAPRKDGGHGRPVLTRSARVLRLVHDRAIVVRRDLVPGARLPGDAAGKVVIQMAIVTGLAGREVRSARRCHQLSVDPR